MHDAEREASDAASAMLVDSFVVRSPHVSYTEEAITSTYDYASTRLSRTDRGDWEVEPTTTRYEFRVERPLPKLGCGGPDGMTCCACILIARR